MRKKAKKILDIVLWILGIVAIGFLVWGIFKILLK